MNEKSALIVVDIQNDFCPGGALAVNEGDRIVPLVNRLMEKFSVVVGTQDWHPKDHMSFASRHEGKNPFDVISAGGIEQVLWPDHCVQGTEGAAFHSGLNTDRFNIIIRKGANPELDSYSAFLENDKKTKTGLDGYLRSLEISEIYLCGLATDFCVFFSAMDARSLNFETVLIPEACRGIDVPENNIQNALDKMAESGVKTISSEAVLNG